MKFLSSFIKEIVLASRSFYFYIEIGMAIVLLLIMLFVVPDSFDNRSTEYIYYDLPKELVDTIKSDMLKQDLDHKSEEINMDIEDREVSVSYYKTDNKKYYIVNTNKQDLIDIAKDKKKLGIVMKLNEKKEMIYDYFLQGYETDRLKNIYKLVHAKSSVDSLEQSIKNQEVVTTGNYDKLSDRENSLPPMLAINCGLMGIFIIAAYVFLDKKEGTIRAFAVSPCPIYQYLLSKTGIITITGIVSSLIILIPLMGSTPNYLMLIVLLVATGFFSSSIGLLIASFFKDVIESMGTIVVVLITFVLPVIGYYIPSWNPQWLSYIPSYQIIQSIKEIILQNGDMSYVALSSLRVVAIGIVVFIIANLRYKKILSV
ncbi:ABC transporter permease [Clostridiaceae bacterium M8S5]|nr:ABC transporter permease [Clostridiaceae bacterium M8S5]